MPLLNPFPEIPWLFQSRFAGSTRMATLRRAWQWLTLVRTNDPLRLVLNSGFAYITLVEFLFIVLLSFVNIVNGAPTIEIVVDLVAIPVIVVAWWLNRSGTTRGASLFTALCILGTAIGMRPSEYAGEIPFVHISFMFSVIAATLFIRPRAGLWALGLQLAALGIALVIVDMPFENIRRFLSLSAVIMGSMTLFLITGATLISRALRFSIAANDSLQRLNADLEQLVAQRTADLQIAYESLQISNAGLLDALANVKTLRGLLPICASCKKIRDDSGYWNQIESYISARSEAEFSHGICPECTWRLYPDLYDEAERGA
jgi:hypothetical protein